jgi:16S rRNA A1518/A1519 N6-dimethyltransferase RsmA/KsgA/DIM1 with predicted DNA glycosylase/AP lyase activity
MISEPIFHRLFKLGFKSAAFIVSMGFAKKITGNGEDSKLGLLSKLMFQTQIIATVPPEAYLPPPATATAIISIQHKEPENKAGEILQAVFQQEDKKTGNALREALIQTGISETKRSARQTIIGLGAEEAVLDTPVARLSFDQISALILLIETHLP